MSTGIIVTVKAPITATVNTPTTTACQLFNENRIKLLIRHDLHRDLSAAGKSRPG
jgi:hypothetical protein